MSLEFQKIASHIVNINKAEFLVDVMLSNVDVIMVKTVLIQSRSF